MASRAVQTLLASRHEKSRLDRIVVRVGAAAAWLATVIYIVAGAITGEASLFFQAVGPLLAASIMTVQIGVRREDGALALFASDLIVVFWYTFFGVSEVTVPAAVSLVLITSLAMLFVNEYRVVVAAALGVALFALPFIWDMGVVDQVRLGSVMALSFGVTYFIFGSIQSASSALNTRYQMLFDQSPTAVVEEDWSEAVEYVRSEYTGKPDRIRQFLSAYPMVVRQAVSRAKVLRANQAAMELLGVRHPERFLGYRNPDVVNDENMAAFVSGLVCLYQNVSTWESEVPARTRSGKLRWIQFRSVDTSTGVPASSIITAMGDITHMKDRNEAMAELVRTKDEFIASVSHELRTPLTAVIGLTSEMAATPNMSATEQQELLDLVSGQAAEMSNIIDDLLVAARAGMNNITLHSDEVDLVDELSATVEGMGISVELPEETVPVVYADARRVRQILRNLLTNAQRYGGPDRRVVVGTIIGEVWLEVRDNGPGISDEEAAHIFEPYVTGGARTQASVGLGLSVARQLAVLMGGSLQYERSAAETVFRLQLPIADGREPVMAVGTGEAPQDVPG